MHLRKQEPLWKGIPLRRAKSLWTVECLQTGISLRMENCLALARLSWMRNFPVLVRPLRKMAHLLLTVPLQMGMCRKKHPFPGKTWRRKQRPAMTAGWHCCRKIRGRPPSKVMERRIMQTILLRNFPPGPERKPEAAQGKITLKFQPLPEGGKQKPPLLQNRNRLYGRPPLPPSLP